MSFYDLTPGQVLVLLDPNKSQGWQAIGASLMWLLAKKHLTTSLEHRPGFWGQFLAKRTYLRTAENPAVDLPSDLKAVLRLATCAGVMDEFIKIARFEYGFDLGGFLAEIINPSLMRRGLIEARTETVFFFILRTRYFRTPTGEAMRQKVDTLMTEASDIRNSWKRVPFRPLPSWHRSERSF